jgi:hypothetical protein
MIYVPVAQLDSASDSDVSGELRRYTAQSIENTGLGGIVVESPAKNDYYLTTK